MSQPAAPAKTSTSAFLHSLGPTQAFGRPVRHVGSTPITDMIRPHSRVRFVPNPEVPVARRPPGLTSSEHFPFMEHSFWKVPNERSSHPRNELHQLRFAG